MDEVFYGSSVAVEAEYGIRAEEPFSLRPLSCKLARSTARATPPIIPKPLIG
jgi:hypothetical protein